MTTRREHGKAALGSPYDCQECGQLIEAQTFHDYVECVRQRVRTRYAGFGREMALADVVSLIHYIDKLEPERQGRHRA